MLAIAGAAPLAVVTDPGRPPNDRPREAGRTDETRAVYVPVSRSPKDPLDERLRRLTWPLARLERRTPGELGVAIAPLRGGRIRTFGRLQTGRAWSAIKVPLAAAYLDHRPDPGAAGRSRVAATIRRSDNDAARHLWGDLAGSVGGEGARLRIERMLRRAGDRRTVVSSYYGSTTWRLSDALRTYRALARGELLGPDATAYLLRLMRTLDPATRWGFARHSGAAKGGWGPDAAGRYLVEQVAIVRTDDGAYVVAVMVRTLRPREPGEDAFRIATRTIDRVAAVVTERVGGA